MKRDNEGRILDMYETITRIEKYTQGERSGFDNSELVQTWVVYHLQVVGEAAYKVTQDFREQYPDIPWKDIAGMRHVIVHDYLEIDLDTIWAAVEFHLPKLKAQLKQIIEEKNISDH